MLERSGGLIPLTTAVGLTQLIPSLCCVANTATASSGTKYTEARSSMAEEAVAIPAGSTETEEKWMRVRAAAIPYLSVRTEKHIELKRARRARLLVSRMPEFQSQLCRQDTNILPFAGVPPVRWVHRGVFGGDDFCARQLQGLQPRARRARVHLGNAHSLHPIQRIPGHYQHQRDVVVAQRGARWQGALASGKRSEVSHPWEQPILRSSPHPPSPRAGERLQGLASPVLDCSAAFECFSYFW